MSRLIIHAKAKVNLSIDVVGKRPDGYHNLVSIMQSVSLFDRIVMETSDIEGIVLNTSLPFLPTDERNLAYRAAKLFLDAAEIKKGVSINIQKTIPIGGGLGGGSSDAAAVLSGLNHIYKDAVPATKLSEIALQCGADVPFCMTGGTCLCEGVGEILSPLPPLPDCFILIIKPPFSVSTKNVYSSLSLDEINIHPDTEKLIAALENKNLGEFCSAMYNVLEPVATNMHSQIADYRATLDNSGALGSLMSGSGSSVFGIFETKEAVLSAQKSFKKMHIPSFITTPVSSIF